VVEEALSVNNDRNYILQISELVNNIAVDTKHGTNSISNKLETVLDSALVVETNIECNLPITDNTIGELFPL